MTQATAASVLVCRLAALAGAGLALCALALGAALLPPVLERWILLGEVGGARGAALYAAAAACALAGLGLLAAALRLWRRAPEIRARSVHFAAFTAAWLAALVLLAAEAAARLAFEPEEILSGEAFWIHRRIALRAAHGGSQSLQPEHPVVRYDTELGWVTVADYRSDGLNTNSRGLRGTQEHALPKPAGVRRIVLVGDSLSFGDGVRDEDVWVAILDELLGNVEVANLAVLGYGTDQQYLRLKREGPAYEPDLVIVAAYGPDLDRNVLSFRDVPKPRFRLRNGALALENVPVPDSAAIEARGDPLPLLRSSAVVVTGLAQLVDRTRHAPKWELGRGIFDALLAEAHARDAELLLLHLPEKRASVDWPDGYELVFQAWAQKRGVAFLSLRHAFRALAPADRGRIWSGHWTPFGNRVVAEAVAHHLAEHPELLER